MQGEHHDDCIRMYPFCGDRINSSMPHSEPVTPIEVDCSLRNIKTDSFVPVVSEFVKEKSGAAPKVEDRPSLRDGLAY